MIAVVDYGMGNLRSVQKALQRVGGDAHIVETPGDIAAADKIVLPGVGAFADAMARLREQKLTGPLASAIDSGKPFLGICLGLQLLFETSHEDGLHEGLGVLAGEVVRFDFDSSRRRRKLRVPQMGWNRIRWRRRCPLLDGIPHGAYVYFAHSYHVAPEDSDITLTTTEYGYRFASSVWRDNLFATQFHPEKSQAVGLKLLENFVNL
ncbi:MAG: imidazole glycerol phosphate synthase subunit HisH [Phycisphaerae bacterium]